jgi:hypothetical protein
MFIICMCSTVFLYVSISCEVYASYNMSLHAADGWQSGGASDERRLNTGDGWQSGDASN